MSKPTTKHFKVYTGYAPTQAFYETLVRMADKWDSQQVEQVRLFFAGITDVYVSIKARQWYHFSVANDPDYTGDAQDHLERGKLQCRTLDSRPRPKRSWLGEWREFNNAGELKGYAQERLEKLAAFREQ